MVHAPSRVQAIRYDFGCQMRILSDLVTRATDPFTTRVQQIRSWLEDAERLFLDGLSKARTAESEDVWLANIETVVRVGGRLISSLQADMANHQAREGKGG